MEADWRSLIEAVHRTPVRLVVAVTGGGTGAAAALLGVPGASRTVLEIQVPYGEVALADFLGARPEQFCSPETARALARRAYARALWLAPGERALGVGCTASLATDRPKRGDHRFHVAVRSAERISVTSLTLDKRARDREGEEFVLDAVFLNAVAEALGLSERVAVPPLPGERVEAQTAPHSDAVASVVRGELAAVCVLPDGRLEPDAPKPAVIVSGAFNPVHAGHEGMAGVAERLTGLPAAIELSVWNVDKPALTVEEVRRRVSQFAWRAPLWVTRAPTFADKAVLFPCAIFVVGADTAQRTVAARYYSDREEDRCAALARIREAGGRFLVAARVDAAGRLVRLADLVMPEDCRDLFAEIPEGEFRLDISSTQLRGSQPGPG
jgi:hypothetical protein